MEDFSDDDYDRLSDVQEVRSESEHAPNKQESAPSSPPSVPESQGRNRKTLLCPYKDCPKSFNRKARLEDHIRSHKNIRLFKCPHFDCGKDFLRQSHLNHHTKNAHSNIRDYHCTWPGCDKGFATGTRLRRHISAHEGREKFRCRGYDGCNETFRKHETLRKHILSVHENTRPFRCEDIDLMLGQPCDKTFDTAEKLERHRRALHDTMKFSCADCLTQSEINESTQDSHFSKRMLTGFFATFSDLQAHIAEVHPPTCDYCPLSFKTVRELTRHLEIQHGQIDPNTTKESKVICTYPDCGRVFTKKGNLTVHIKTVHEKKKAFVCGMTPIPFPEEAATQPDVQIYGCGRAFGTKATLQDHVRSAHLGLQSKVVENRHKRKADQATSQNSEDFHESKKRSARKDKGTTKSSAFAALTGMTAGAPNMRDGDLRTGLDDSVYAFSQTHISEDVDAAEDSDEENDAWNEMTSSMTLCGNNMYHNGRQYHYTNGQYPPGLPLPELSIDLQQRARSNSIQANTMYGQDLEEEDPIFDNFEHEPEILYGPVDPVLLRL